LRYRMAASPAIRVRNQLIDQWDQMALESGPHPPEDAQMLLKTRNEIECTQTIPGLVIKMVDIGYTTDEILITVLEALCDLEPFERSVIKETLAIEANQ
jgi:hypothetical protein